METMEKKLLVVAGEVSGDLHGSALLEALHKNEPGLAFFGIGGDGMIKAGLNAAYHINNMAFLGIVEVIRHLPFIRKVQKDLLAIIDREEIKTAVLIDYPGFNLNLARKLHKRGIRVIYYISPQIWAWGSHRVKKIRKYVDTMLTVFPFEKEFYRKNGVDAEFVGHPLIERLERKEEMTDEMFYNMYPLKQEDSILLVLPGSRTHEVENIFPPAIEAAAELADKYGMQIVVAAASTISDEVFEPFKEKTDFFLYRGDTFEIMKRASFGLIKSGTSTIEATVSSLPMVILYKTNPLTYRIGKMLVNVKNLGMVNILAGKTIAPELIQGDLTAENIVGTVSGLLDNPGSIAGIKETLEQISGSLGKLRPSEEASRIILALLKEGSGH